MVDSGEGALLDMSTPNPTPAASDILAMLRNIRRAPGQEGDYAPHKPLMLLMALARIQHGSQRLAPFAEVEPQIKNLLREFAKTGAENTRHLPYWRLKNDHAGRLWEVIDPLHQIYVDVVDPPSLTALRASSVEAGFSPEVHFALSRNPSLLAKAANDILESNFPSTLHQDIAQALGLNLQPLGTEVREEPDADEYNSSRPTRRPRNPAFRDEVLRAYEYRCCVCGFDLRVGHLPVGLEAAHIQWHMAGGPDEVPNGLSLCALHHKLFDLGAFTIEPSDHRVIFSQHAIAGSRGLQGELRHHGQVLLAPQQAPMRPGSEYLAWNVRNVFKAPGREWAA